MPKIDIANTPVRTRTVYPGAYAEIVKGRSKQRLGDAGGLSQFGVNLTRLAPGAASAHRHWHEAEDEFVYVLEGEVMLVEDDGETLLRTGDAAAFKAGVANGHHLVNRGDRDAVFLEVGTRSENEVCTYTDPNVDMRFVQKNGKPAVTRKNGKPL